jgi:hypothetical protein
MLAEIWHDWLEAISDVAYQTHRTCEFLAENTNPSPFDAYSHQSDGANSSIDMKKLAECLQSMDSMQAARVIHAVQMMQAMEATLQRRRSRAKEEAPW